MTSALGFAPSLQLDGALDTMVPDEITEHLLTALRESLSNAARHAGATQVDVTITVDHDLVLTVRDNGVGIAPGGRRSGLRNLEQRAVGLGGSLTARPRDGGGTELIWRVPLSRPRPGSARGAAERGRASRSRRLPGPVVVVIRLVEQPGRICRGLGPPLHAQLGEER